MQELSREALLELVADKRRPGVDRAKAIDNLMQEHHMRQAEIAKATKLSEETISHVKACTKLQGLAAQMCRDGKINLDACYSLASASDVDQELVLRRAMELENADRSRQAGLLKGRRTRAGQITDRYVKTAIKEARMRAKRSNTLDKHVQASGNRQFDVVIERDEEGYYVASVPSIPGCHTQAKSLDDLTERIREAIELCLEAGGVPKNELEFVGIQRITIAA
jgi:predicted RNase H-like HicB family nuclease